MRNVHVGDDVRTTIAAAILPERVVCRGDGEREPLLEGGDAGELPTADHHIDRLADDASARFILT